MPRAPYSAWLPRSVPCAAVPAPASAPARVPLGLWLPLGCGGARARLGRRAAPPGPAVRAGAGRTGGAGSSGPAPTIPERAVGGRLRGPALPCRSPASPPVAVPTPPLAPPSPSWVLLGGGAAPWSQLGGGGGGGAARVIAEMGTRGRWERRAAPLCAQPARHPHSGGGGRGQGGEEALGCREAGAPGRCVKGGQTDTCREGWTNHMSEKDSQTGWTETRAKGRTEGGGGRRDTACWPLGWAEEPVRAASSQLLEFSSRRLGQGFQSELPAGLFSSPLAHPLSSVLADASLPWKIPGSGEGSGFLLLLCIHHFGGLRHAHPLPSPGLSFSSLPQGPCLLHT